MRRKRIHLLICTTLLTVGALVCALRWRAWTHEPVVPDWEEDEVPAEWLSLADTTVDGWLHTYDGWTPLEDTVRMLVLGDVHSGLTHDDYMMLSQRHPDINMVVQTGDWVERYRPFYYYRLRLDAQGTRLAEVPIVACPGNHEYSKGFRHHLNIEWREEFRHPNNGPKTLRGESHYIDLCGLRLIVLDTEGTRRLSEYTRTAAWLRQVIASAEGRRIMVVMHHPVFSVAPHRLNVGEHLLLHGPLRKAQLVLAGHDHSYVRRLPFVVLNTCDHYKPQRTILSPEKQLADTRVYMLVNWDGKTLSCEVRCLETGEMVDQWTR